VGDLARQPSGAAAHLAVGDDGAAEPLPEVQVGEVLELARICGGALGAPYVRFGRAVEVATAEAENYHVDLPLSGSARFRTGRRECVEGTPRRAGVFMPGEPAAIDWSGGCGQFCLMFPRAVLQRELEGMLDRPLVKPLVFAEAMDVSTDAGRS
jgi:hypothetical protein